MIREIDFSEDGEKLIRYIDEFPKATVLVLGDIIMDEYIWGDVSRISPEARRSAGACWRTLSWRARWAHACCGRGTAG